MSYDVCYWSTITWRDTLCVSQSDYTHPLTHTAQYHRTSSKLTHTCQFPRTSSTTITYHQLRWSIRLGLDLEVPFESRLDRFFYCGCVYTVQQTVQGRGVYMQCYEKHLNSMGHDLGLPVVANLPQIAGDDVKQYSLTHQCHFSIDPFSAGTVFTRQNLTSVDVRFWRIKMVPALKELKYL